MKIFKLNSLTTLLLSVFVITLVMLLPITLIEVLWNNTIGRTYTDFTIDFWQSLILWLIVLVSLNIIGIFRFEFAVENQDIASRDLLKKKIQDLQSKTHESVEIEKKENKESK